MKTAFVIGTTVATGSDLVSQLLPMPTSQVAHAMIVMAKQVRDGVFTLNPPDLWKL